MASDVDCKQNQATCTSCSKKT